ncbi:hypothetical protein QFC19_006633 [Naganishia cerealis]|uniref:Uncharacterized protein n=1 Tax=Naganishia cerealis TaxID=610337 RepID=A0ACC2VFE2_9TREE|nr:hypothetical protein QFC19_006633 [Naganishia cerealis]
MKGLQSVHGPVSPPDPPPDVDTIGIDFLTGYLHDDKENGVVARAAICSLLRIAFNQPGFTTVECSSESSVRSSIAKHLCSDSSNFVEVLIAGLGAVYSVLPNRIRLETADEIALTCGSETMRLGSQPHPPMHDISSEIPFSSDDNVKCLFDGDVKTQLALLLDSIAFSNHIMQIIGDTTTSTNRVNVSRNKLQTSINAALQASFIGNVLYPALLESSTGDGSATAVAAYLACIFEDDSVVHHTSVGSVIIHHLLNLSPPQDCAENIQYTLRDCLIDMFLHGSRDNTIAASTLLEAIMHKYCDKVSIAILTEPSPTSTRFARDLKCFANDRMTVPTFLAIQSRAQTSSTPSRNAVPVLLPDGLNGTESASVYSPHAVQSYLALLPPLLSGQKSNDASDPQTQEAYEIDAFMAMSCHPCLTGSLARLDPLSQDKESQQHPHLRMNCDGSFLKAIRGRLRNFFSSEPYANLELTQAICKTANCPMTELEGWMLPENAKSPGKTVLGQDEVDLLNDPFLDYGTDSRNPVVLKLVGELVDDVKRFRASVPGFDTYLAERREGLLGIATNAKVETSIRSVISGEVDNPEDPTSLTPTKSTRTRMVSVLTSFLTPRKPAPSTPSLASQSKLATSPAEHFGTTADTHYRQTTSVVLDSPQHETLNVSASPYSILKRNKRVVQASLVSDTSSTASSEMYTSAAAAATNPGPNVHHVTLSRVLDNVVLLEAFIRQIVALLVARRSLGVDDLY